MQLKLTLLKAGLADHDLKVEADAATTIRSVAQRLAHPPDGRGDDRPARRQTPQRSSADDPVARNLTLRVICPGRAQSRLLDPDSTVAESAFLSGCRVEVVPLDQRRAGDIVDVTAVAVVGTGPHARQRFRLSEGHNSIGRDPTAEVCLDADKEVSRHHATITIGHEITVGDIDSANGLYVDGVRVDGATLRSDSVIQVGNSKIQVTRPSSRSDALADEFPAHVTRSPLLQPEYRGRTFALPKSAERSEKQAFPAIAVAAPAILGASLFLATRQPSSLIFIALSPAILIGTWLDGRIRARRKRRRQVAAFDEDLATLQADIAAEQDRESAARNAEAPPTAAIMQAVRARSGLVWSRSPEHRFFLTVRYGTGTLPSLSKIGPLPEDVQGQREDTRLEKVIEQVSVVSGVPVSGSIQRSGSIGIAGSRSRTEETARAVLLQLAGLHSPAELGIAVFAGAGEAPAWSWLKWLPHIDGPHNPLRAQSIADDCDHSERLLDALERLLARRRGVTREPPPLPALVVLVTAGSTADHSRLVTLGEHGADLGIHLIWLAPKIGLLPAICRTFIEIDASGSQARAGFVRTGLSVPLGTMEGADAVTAEEGARTLAPLIDDSAGSRDTSLPDHVAFGDLHHDDDILIDPQAVVRRWVDNDTLLSGWIPGTPREPGGFECPVGFGPSGAFSLDLRSHGPHALVGGTTGSGKSEFLRTWIMGMASSHSPDRLTFLLVDYKGGAAFAECSDLPHTVGLVTDLTPHLVKRSLISLRAELVRRESLLKAKSATDVRIMEERSDPEAPPALVIVVDEFAALTSDAPEFIDGIVDIAQRGRSLGMHLILATQRPSGVIKASLRANTNLRIALRVADEADSTDIVGAPDAAAFNPATPGRAIANFGAGANRQFQSAYLSGTYVRNTSLPEVRVHDLPFGTGSVWPTRDSGRFPPTGPRAIAVFADTIARAACARHVKIPRKPWLPPLRSLVSLDDLARDERVPSEFAPGEFAPDGPAPDELARDEHARHRRPGIVVGMIDLPAQQRQDPYPVRFDVVGNLAILGTSGTGKTNALRTIAIAASAHSNVIPVAIYGIDCGGGGLAPLEALPTVGSIIEGRDSERTRRLVRMLEELIVTRTKKFADTRSSSIDEYWALTQERDPCTLVLVDGIGSFRAENERHRGLLDRLVSIAATGRQFGVHLVITADRLAAIPSEMLANIGERFVLRLANDSEYASCGVPNGALDDAPPGRALTRAGELQFAVPAASTDLAIQAAAIEELAVKLFATRTTPTRPITRLPSTVLATDLPMLVDGRSTIGVVEETLQPIGYRVEGLFVITGPFGSGRSTAMRTAVQSAIAARPGDKAYLFSGGNSALLDAIDWDAASRTADASAKLAADLTECILDPTQGTGERPERRLRSQWPAHSLDPAPNPAADPAVHRSDAGILIVVEDIAGFAGTPAENEIVRLLGLARNSDIRVIAEAETVTAHNAWQLLNELKTARAGLSLQPNDGDGMLLFRTDFPGAVRAEFPVGRGILVESGRTTRIQVALPRATSEITEGAIKYAGGAHRTTTRGATSGPGDGPAHSRTQFVGDETRARTGRRRAIR